MKIIYRFQANKKKLSIYQIESFILFVVWVNRWVFEAIVPFSPCIPNYYKLAVPTFGLGFKTPFNIPHIVKRLKTRVQGFVFGGQSDYNIMNINKMTTWLWVLRHCRVVVSTKPHTYEEGEKYTCVGSFHRNVQGY